MYILLIAFVSFLSRDIKSNTHKKKITAFILWLGLFLIMALRAETVGNDLSRYIESYKNIAFTDLWETRTEIGYVYFLKVLDFFNITSQGYIVVTSFFISSLFSWFIYKYSNKIGYSFLLHVTIGLFAITLSGIRQSMAISIILIAINFVLARKFISFTFLVFIATLFHQSAIIFFPAYFLFSIGIKNYKSMIYLILTIVVLFFLSNNIFSYVGFFTPERYSSRYLISEQGSSGMNLLPILFRFSLPIILILYWKFQNVKINMIPKIDIYFFVLGIVSVVISVLSLNLSVIDRLSYYYYVPLMVLIPNILNRYKKNDIGNYNIFIGLIIILSILYFSISTPDGVLRIDNYKFFWE